MTRLFKLNELAVSYESKRVLQGVTVAFRTGEFATIAGPNGAGKSTLLNAMSGIRSRYSGSCKFRDKEVRDWSRRAFAREVAVVPQSLRVDFPFTVEQVVLMGRAPFANTMFESDEDRYHVDRVMRLTGIAELCNRDFRTLSGGEKQRAVIASALAQMPTVLLLDEPTAFLDIEHQLSLYALLRKLCENGVLVIAVTHDLNLAAAYSDRMILVHDGQIAADGLPAEVLQPSILEDVFRVRAQVITNPTGRPWIRYGP